MKNFIRELFSARTVIVLFGLILLTEISFKIVQIYHESPSLWPDDIQKDIKKYPPHRLVWAISRRCDDAYFWAVAALIFTGLGIIDVQRRYNLLSMRQPIGPLPRDCFAIGAASLVPLYGVYIVAVWMEPETFFDHSTGIIKTLQTLEGALNLLAIALGVWFAGFGYRIARALMHDMKNRVAKEIEPLCRDLIVSCLTPLVGFSIFFFAYQALVGHGLALDELVTLGGAAVIYAGPFVWLQWPAIGFGKANYMCG